MYPSIRSVWVEFNRGLEGIVNGPYCDVLGLVTVGMGNKIDPVRDALGLPWVSRDSGLPAPKEEIRAAWAAVKNDPLCATRGWRYALSMPANNIRLNEDAIDALITARLDANDEALKDHFPNFELWPADAQLAVHSMVWAMGFGGLVGKFPKCCRALANADFTAASAECKMVPEAGTLVMRNKLNASLLLNAAETMSSGGPPSVLAWSP